MPAVSDEIFEKYLQKAIAESNELGDEVARAAGEGRVPVVGSGHPLADVMLLKYAPQPSEVQEGVAFYGRAGQAILKSLQRLRVDPMAVYGTNCLKFVDGDPDEARPWPMRELHIVQPKIVVVMGEEALAFLGFVLIPAVFGLVWLALPFWPSPVLRLFLAALVFAAIAVVLQAAGASVPANFAKLGAMTAFAWIFLHYFEDASWVVLVAVIIPWVDAYSVWRGPTNKIVTHHEHVFTLLSFSFPVPGENGAAKLGLPDLMFFALFLAAAVRFNLRVGWTWIGLTASVGATMALATWWDVGGLPALPLLSAGFLVPNADLLWPAV